MTFEVYKNGSLIQRATSQGQYAEVRDLRVTSGTYVVKILLLMEVTTVPYTLELEFFNIKQKYKKLTTFSQLHPKIIIINIFSC